MKDLDQKQEAGDNSQNLQAGRDIIINGLTFSETKEIARIEAQKVFKQNSIILADEAYHLFVQRSDEFLENFLNKLEQRKPEAISSLKDPGMQYSLYNAQREYAKTGDKELADILEDILVERGQSPTRDLHQIVLDECINIIPKLTPDQFDALSVIFLLRYTSNNSISNLLDLVIFFSTHIHPFENGINDNLIKYQHLEFCGCGSLGGLLATLKIEAVFREQFSGLFSKGFTLSQFEDISNNNNKIRDYLIPCLQNKTKFQIKFINKDVAYQHAEIDKLSTEEISLINSLMELELMSNEEIKDFLLKFNNIFSKTINAWERSPARFMTLTSVGIAIGHANLVRKTKRKSDLRIWIK